MATNDKDIVPIESNAPEPDLNPDYLPSAESYEAIGENLELAILEEKRRINLELQDELLRLEYLLNQKEQRLKVKELELLQREAELKLREDRLNKQIQFEELKSPKEQATKAGFDIDSSQEDFESPRDKSYLGGRNKGGVGGKPGSDKSEAIVINENEFQGNTIILEDNSVLNWNPDEERYQLLSQTNQGLKFTYFAVEAAYLNKDYINPSYPQFFSQTILGKQVWYEKTPYGRKSDGLGELYKGRVPFEVLMKTLNDSLNSAQILPDGNIIENQDFRRAYKNWRFTYDVGTYFKNASGDLYQILESHKTDSKGNAPAYRTDANPKSSTFGDRVPTSAEERGRWKGSFNSSSKGKKGSGARRKRQG